MKRRFRLAEYISLIMGFVIMAEPCEAFFYHAARKGVTRRILRHGLDPRKARATGRFSSGIYVSKRPSTALAEKGAKGNEVIRFRESKMLGSKIIDLRKPTSEKLKSILGPRYDLRGAYKKGVIGPKTGRKIGRWAGTKEKALEVRSAKTGGTNVVIPKSVAEKHPGIVRPEKVVR